MRATPERGHEVTLLGRLRFLGFVVTLVIVAYGVWSLDLSQVGEALRSANYAFLPISIAATFCSYLLRTARWQHILAPAQQVPVRQLYGPLMIGFMANNLLPARMGELVRAHSVGRSVGLSRTLALGTIALERVFDGLALVTILGTLALLGVLPAAGGPLGYVAAALFIGVTIAAWLLIAKQELAFRIFRTLVRPLPGTIADFAEQRAQSFTSGLRVLHEPRTLLTVIVVSAAVWTCETLSYYALIVGFGDSLGIGAALPAAFFLTVVVNLGIMVPAAPGYVGTFETAAIAALAPFGVAAETALALAIVAHAVQWLLVTGIGAIILARSGFSLRMVQAVERT